MMNQKISLVPLVRFYSLCYYFFSNNLEIGMYNNYGMILIQVHLISHFPLFLLQVLTRLMDELDHPIPNTELSTMDTLADVVTFFSTPVVDRSAYEDLSKLNLPKNLHIQMEPVRFHPETDTFFDGVTAFPDRPTVVSSLKYRRKFKGHSGESRNQRSITEFERQKELEADRARLRMKRLPSEGE